jgi:hypothetical protein
MADAGPTGPTQPLIQSRAIVFQPKKKKKEKKRKRKKEK